MPSLPCAERFLRQILLHGACKRVGDDERGRRQIIRLDVRADAAFEVAVAGEHGGGDDPLPLIAFEISGASGPEFPMQVVQPKPTRLKPILSR